MISMASERYKSNGDGCQRYADDDCCQEQCIYVFILCHVIFHDNDISKDSGNNPCYNYIQH